MYYVYAIKNSVNNKIYIGQTIDLKSRLARHNGELPTKATSFTKNQKSNGYWYIIHSEEYNNREEAINREKQLKSARGRKFIKELSPVG